MPSHHNCFCSIIPAHILEAIERNGKTPAERQAAQEALAINQRQRILRTATANIARPPAVAVVAPNKSRTIYDAKTTQSLPGTVVRTEGGAATGDASADEAYDGLGATFDLYWNIYGRNSIDDAGLPLDATVHYGVKYDNAFWNSTQMVFGDGDGQYFNRFTIAIDIMGHELTHGVTGDTAKLNYTGQSGALNESISDVFGSLVKQYSKNQTATAADWLIGEGIFTANVSGSALRSMKAPGTAYNDPVLGKDPQPDHMSKYVNTTSDDGGVHINSGIPNKAFYQLAVALGGNAWDKAGNIWYRTLLDPRLKPTAQFQDFANLTVDVAGKLYGKVEKQAAIDSWSQVGITVYDEAKWITALYADLLSRAPDKNGLDGWVAARLGGSSLSDIVTGFLRSAEYCTTLATSFYADLLGRAPDAGGLQGWVAALQGGSARHDVIIGFLDSTEYKSNNAVPGAFVESLYLKLLGRAADPNGKQGWVDALNAGATTADVIRGFLFSAEYCTQRITELYSSLLGRNPDADGLAGWVGAMQNGEAFQKIQYGFLASDEYRARAVTRFAAVAALRRALHRSSITTATETTVPAPAV